MTDDESRIIHPDRREFLRYAGITGAVAAGSSLLPLEALAQTTETPASTLGDKVIVELGLFTEERGLAVRDIVRITDFPVNKTTTLGMEHFFDLPVEPNPTMESLRTMEESNQGEYFQIKVNPREPHFAEASFLPGMGYEVAVDYDINFRSGSRGQSRVDQIARIKRNVGKDSGTLLLIPGEKSITPLPFTYRGEPLHMCMIVLRTHPLVHSLSLTPYERRDGDWFSIGEAEVDIPKDGKDVREGFFVHFVDSEGKVVSGVATGDMIKYVLDRYRKDEKRREVFMRQGYFGVKFAPLELAETASGILTFNRYDGEGGIIATRPIDINLKQGQKRIVSARNLEEIIPYDVGVEFNRR